MAETALIVVDMQMDFMPGGALGVSGGDEILPAVNAEIEAHATVVLTQDWHPANHLSFAANHPGAEPASVIQMPYGPQVLWPVHCVIGSDGAHFHRDLIINKSDLILRKGFRPEVDSYSAFYENDHKTPTGLAGYLRERGITDLCFVGLAYDFCVAWSALDAVRQGFAVKVIGDACRAIDLDGSLMRAETVMRNAGVDIK